VRLTHTPLGLHVIGFTSLSAIVDMVFFKRDNKHYFRAVVAVPYEQKGTYRLYLPNPLSSDAFPQGDPPMCAIYVKRRYKNLVRLYPSPVWSYTVYYDSDVAAGYSWIFTGRYDDERTTYSMIGIPPTRWKPPVEYVLLVNTQYAVVEAEEEFIPQVANGNIESCTVLDSVVCDPALSYLDECLQINYNCRIPFRVTKDNILYLSLEHSLRFLGTPATEAWKYLLL